MKDSRKAIMAKAEVTYAVDPVAAGATDAFQAVNFAWSGAAKAVTDELVYAADFYGSRDKFVISLTRECTFELPWMGGGAPAGTNLPAPLLAVLRACGYAAVVVGGTSVTFSRVNSGEESAVLRATEDGFLRKMLGARGNMRWVWAQGKVPRAMVSLMGLYSTPADEAMPAVTLPTLVKPVGFTKSNTIVTLGGTALKCNSIELDGGRTNAYRNYAGVEEIAPVDVKPTLTLDFELPTAAVKNIYQELETSVIQAAVITHGTVVGNICTTNAPRAELIDLADKKVDGQVFVTAKFELLPGLTGAAPFTHVLT